MFIRDDSIQYGILDRTFQTAYFTAGLQVEYPHNFFSVYRRLEIAYPVFFFQVFQFLAYQFEVIQEFLFSCFIFEVMSASHSIIKSSISSPASKSRRRTAESVTTSSAITMGRMCRLTNFWTYFIFSFMGSFILRKRSGIIFSPIKL